VKARDDGTTGYERLPDPGDEEKVAILEALEDWKRTGRQVRFGGESGGRREDVDRRPVTPRGGSMEPRGWQPRTPHRGGPSRRRRFVQNVREAGPSQVAGTVCVSGGLVMKFWANLSLWSAQIYGFFYHPSGAKTANYERVEKIFGNVEKHLARAQGWVTFLSEWGSYFWESWDSVLLVSLGVLLLWRWRKGPSETSEQIQMQRREDQDRYDRLERMMERQHREQMDAHRTSGPSGDLGALESRLSSFEQGIRRDSGRGTASGSGARSSTEPAAKSDASWLGKMQDKMDRLLRRAQNPLERVQRLIKNMRVVHPWNFQGDFQSRLSADWALSLYGSGQLGRNHAQQYRRDHGLEACEAFNPYDALCDISDAFLMDDEIPDLFNTHGYERIARWGYALQQVMAEVREERDWKAEKGKGKTQWHLMARYHPTEARVHAAYSAEAEEEVSGALQRDALLQKWLKKAAEAP
jgi:hypothetical protein